MDDLSIYFRQHGDHLGIGSYDHPAKLVDPNRLPKSAMMPFTADDFDNYDHLNENNRGHPKTALNGDGKDELNK